MPDELLQRLQRFQTDAFPLHRSHFRHLVDDGQHPMTLFIGCSDSRLVPYLLTGAGPGELFLVRNVGAFVPPHDQSQGFHGTAAAIEFAVLNLSVKRIVVCGHSHCGAIRALYGDVSPAAKHLSQWLELGREAAFIGSDAPAGLGIWLELCERVPVCCLEPAPGEQRALPELPGYRGPLLVAAGPDGSFLHDGAPVANWRVPVPSADERVALWQLAAGDAALARQLGEDYRHASGRIHELARAGRFQGVLEGSPGMSLERIARAARNGAAAELGTLAELQPETIDASALVLPAALHAELEALALRCTGRDKLAPQLGPATRARYRPGVRALLYGPSGTGKTLAVGWLATRLGLPLYRVDLASDTTKYIGETEKNLAQLFARAEHAEVVLMFDEADALFGKRTEVKDANDRYANAQTNYLLQRIESFEGITILTSNSRARFDSAFTRRLDTIIEFPLPAPDERRALWLAHLGDGHALPLADINRLAAAR